MYLPTHKDEVHYGNNNKPSSGVHQNISTHSGFNGGYNNYQNGPWVNSCGNLTAPTQSIELRSRPNALRLQPNPVYYPYTNSYKYPMDNCSSNGICAPTNLNTINSPGLKEVLATYNSGSTFLYMESRKDEQRGFKWFKRSTQATIILLIIAGLIVLTTLMLLNANLQSRKTTLFETNNHTLPIEIRLSEDLRRSEYDTQGSRDHFRHFNDKLRSRGGDEIEVTVTYSKDDDEEAVVEVVPD